jgi:hypothetical protein
VVAQGGWRGVVSSKERSVHKSSPIFTNRFVWICADLWIEFFSSRFELEFEGGKVMLLGRRIVIVFSRVEVERWREAANR